MLSKLGCLLLVLSFGDSFCSSQDDLPEIDTPLGRVRGYWKILDDRKYAAFEGIPYAKPPVADLRFEEPEPIEAWSEIFEANTPHTCFQTEFRAPEKISGEEDCLYLNVYIPEDSVKNPKALDVIVVIHGGAFMMGSGHTAFNTSLEEDTVIVTFNYRLGILGFLSTEDDVIPGNYGMKDQVLALKWVRDNIASFGGNPHSVTIVGLSAGGASVHLQYFSPLSKGLFVKGLSQSGSALAPWAIRKNALQRAKKLADLVGCPDIPSEELKSCLKQIPAQTLMEQLVYFFSYGNLSPLAPFAPVVENTSANAFLDAEPYQLLKEGKVHDVPWITSFAADDGLLPTGYFWQILDEMNERWVEISPDLLEYNDTLPASKREIVAKEVLDYYLGPGEMINKKNFKQFTKIFTDRLFAAPAELSAKLQANVTKSLVYLYIFNYTEGENNFPDFFPDAQEVEGHAFREGQRKKFLKVIAVSNNQKEYKKKRRQWGVSHGQDGLYFYGMIHINPFSEQDNRLRIACHNMLYSYVNSGIPSFDGTDTWQPTGSEELSYLVVNGPEDLKLHKSESLTPVDFWTKLGLREYDNVVVKDES